MKSGNQVMSKIADLYQKSEHLALPCSVLEAIKEYISTAAFGRWSPL
jgi:hypothetical protein